MSSQDAHNALPAGTVPGEDDLQFETAEYAEPARAMTCVVCRQPVAEMYYEIHGKVVCAACREHVEAARASGSGAGRFLRATVFGGCAAVVGFLIYFGVLKTTGYEIGLISVLVGYLVGTAVRNGSRHRGGWRYQALAVFLTYTAIVASYAGHLVPLMLADFKAKKNAAPAPAAAAPAVAGQPAAPAQAPAAQPAPMLAGQPLALRLAIAVAFGLGLLYALPILAGFQSPIGLLIVGFALWEAWKLNKKVQLVFNGPFRVADASMPDDLPPEGVPSHA